MNGERRRGGVAPRHGVRRQVRACVAAREASPRPLQCRLGAASLDEALGDVLDRSFQGRPPCRCVAHRLAPTCRRVLTNDAQPSPTTLIRSER